PIFQEPSLEDARVEALRAHLSAYPRAKLEAWVRALDPQRAPVASEGGPQRLIRTLEVTLLTGRPLSWWHREAPASQPALVGPVVVLELPRDVLDRRIDRRVERMLERGLVEEVRGLLEAGYGPRDPGLSGVGYREMVRHLRGTWSLGEAADAIRRATRRYARRQLTWLRNQLPGEGVHRLDATRPEQELVEAAVEAWTRALCRNAGRGGGTR
ncbi:MAG TPA: tRNA dimethylallyltransferase, partial [Longimicrobiales bacterium]|nr:tRNA dimethylallyltransferase [Longimicrobiales bacterium]